MQDTVEQVEISGSSLLPIAAEDLKTLMAWQKFGIEVLVQADQTDSLSSSGVRHVARQLGLASDELLSDDAALTYSRFSEEPPAAVASPPGDPKSGAAP